jgi:hypothetical protein
VEASTSDAKETVMSCRNILFRAAHLNFWVVDFFYSSFVSNYEQNRGAWQQQEQRGRKLARLQGANLGGHLFLYHGGGLD